MHDSDYDVAADVNSDSTEDANSDGESDLCRGYTDHGHDHDRYERSSIILAIHWCVIQRIPSISDWDWTQNAYDASIWTATYNIRSGTGTNSNLFRTYDYHEDGNHAGDSRAVSQISDAVETLSVALRFLDVQTYLSLIRLTSSSFPSSH